MLSKRSPINTYTEISKREYECLKLYGYGQTAKETARILDISHRTVEQYIDSLKTKCKVHSKSVLKELV